MSIFFIFALHRNIAHLDIKPQNIMFQNRHSDQIKIIDFGMSKKVPVSGRYTFFFLLVCRM